MEGNGGNGNAVLMRGGSLPKVVENDSEDEEEERRQDERSKRAPRLNKEDEGAKEGAKVR